jgi:hypothetical protein
VSTARSRRHVAREACREVLACRLDPSEFRGRWGALASSDSSFERIVFQDLLDVLEDSSGSPLRGWARLVSRRPKATQDTLRLDLHLLGEDDSEATDAELLRCRYALAGVAPKLDDDCLTDAVQSCVTAGKELRTVVDVRGAERLADLTDHIHDCWFDVGDIEHDRARATVTLPFRCGRGDTVRRVLTFHCVRSVAIHDTEKIGTYDFYELTYDPTTERIRVKTNIPLGFEVDVDEVYVTLDQGAE